MNFTEEELREIAAARAYVESVVPTADITYPYPAWHGWALHQAFRAGARYAKEQSAQQINSDLLAACKAVVEEDGFHGSAIMRKRIDAMREAIAKAEAKE